MKKAAILSIAFIALFLSSISSYGFKDKGIVGTWYGTYYLSSGQTYKMILEVDQLKKNVFRVEIYYPEFFNSRYAADAIFKNDSLLIGLTQTIQGVAPFQVDYSDRMNLKLSDGDILSGTYYVNDELFAEVELAKGETLSSQKIQEFKNTISEATKKYGVLQIGKELELDKDSLTKKAVSVVSSFNNLNVSTMLVEGTLGIGGFEMPARIEIYESRGFYIEMDFQGQKFLSVTTDKLKWEYNPMEDMLTIDSLSADSNETEEANLDNFIGTLAKSLEDSFKITKIFSSTMDGQKALRLVLTKHGESEKRFFYVNPKSTYLLRQEVSGKINTYDQYQLFNGIQLPTLVKEFQTDGQVMEFNFSSYQFDIELDESKLEVPESLMSKLKTGDPSDEILEKANSYYEKEDYVNALNYYSRAIQNGQTEGWIYFRMGKCNHQLGNYYEAIGEFQKAISLEPNDEVYYNDMGLSKYALKDFENAKRDFEKALNIDSSAAVTHYNLANCFYYLKDKEKSYESFAKSIAFDSTVVMYYVNHAYVGAELEKFVEARESLLKAISMDYPDSATLYNRIGVTLYKESMFDSSIFYFDKAIAIDGKDFDYLKNMGTAYYELDDMEQAQGYFEKALEIDDQDDNLLNYLGLTFYNQGDYDGANYYFDKAILINPKNAVYYDNRAYAYGELGSYSKAVDNFTTSIQLYPDDAEVYYQRGLIYQLQHNNFDACRDFKKAMDMGHEGAKEEYKGCSLTDDKDD